MTVYVYRDGQMVDKETGLPMLTDEQRAAQPKIPQIMGFKPYACPVTGDEIRTLGQHNANLKKHNCVEYNEVAKPMNGELKNHRFAAKHGLKIADKYMDQPSLAKGAKNDH